MSTANKELINAISIYAEVFFILVMLQYYYVMRSDFVATKMNSALPTESYNFFWS